MNRWHFPQRDRGLPVAARGEKDTSISSSMPEGKQCKEESYPPGPAAHLHLGQAGGGEAPVSGQASE